MRINKLFSNYGICSRKEVNKLIEDRKVIVNGKFAVLGQWVEEEDLILLDGERIKPLERVYIAFNKPRGITTTAEKNVDSNIIDYINYMQYIFPIGRLDKDSEGLILLTNDGDLANEILDDENYHEKEYIVTVDKKFDDDFLKQMASGVNINGKQSTKVKRISDNEGIIYKDGIKEIISLDNVKHIKENNNIIKTRSCIIEKITEDTFKIILTQGLNRQIRKMTKSFGYTVTRLKRIRIMNIEMNDLKEGQYRNLTESELKTLKNHLIYR